MIADSFFHQGDTHEVCEDYALHGPNYAIVSDGCSNGGGPRIDTDWGARILSKAAQQTIDIQDPQFLAEEICDIAESFIRHIDMPVECLTATLLSVKKFKQGLIVHACGDGFFGGRNKESGIWDIYQIEFPSSAPFYLSYLIEEGSAEYFKRFGNKFKVSHFQVPDNLDFVESEVDLEVDVESPLYTHEFPSDLYDAAFVASDGMGTFHETIETATSKHTNAIPASFSLEVILDILEFRPNFLRLQHNWAFKQKSKGTYLGRKWKPYDDVSVGMVYNG